MDRAKTNQPFRYMNRMRRRSATVGVDLIIAHSHRGGTMRSCHGDIGLMLSLKLYSDDRHQWIGH